MADNTLYTYRDPKSGQTYQYGDPTLNVGDIRGRGLEFVSGPRNVNNPDITQDPLQEISRREARSATAGASGLDKTEAELMQAASSVGPAPVKEDILTQKTNEANRLIDVIRGQFDQVLSGERAAGDVRSARTRASNVTAGLIGSDFGSAAAQETEAANAAIISAKTAERDAKINAILSGIPSTVDKEYKEAADAYRLDAEKGLKTVQDFRDRQRTQSTNTLAAIAASGASFDSLKNSPNYSRILEGFGGDEAALKGTFMASIPEKNKLGSTTVGNKYITFYTDPVSGKQSTVEFDLPQNLGPEETVQQVFANGQVAIKTTTMDANGNKKETLRIESVPGYKPPATGGGNFTADEKRDLTRAGLANTDVRTREVFLNTPPSFRQEYTRTGGGTKDATPSQILDSLEAWEKEQEGSSDPFSTKK